MADSQKVAREWTMQADSVLCHIKVEAEKNVTLAQKGMDPIVPHVEIDLSYQSPVVSVARVDNPSGLMSIGDQDAAQLLGERLRAVLHAANTEAKIAMQELLVNLDVVLVERG